MLAFNGLTLFIGVAMFLIINRSLIPNSKNSEIQETIGWSDKSNITNKLREEWLMEAVEQIKPIFE